MVKGPEIMGPDADEALVSEGKSLNIIETSASPT